MTQAQTEKQTLPASLKLGIDVMHVPATRRRTQTAWSDLFAIGPERFVVLAANVSGSDADKVALLRAVQTAFDPHSGEAGLKMLRQAADAVIAARSRPDAPFATAIIGIVDCFEQSFTYVSAGHPPPIVRYHDGTVAVLPADNRGSDTRAADHPAAQIVVDLHGASLLLLYSSALVWSAGGADDGVLRIRDVLADARMAPCSSPAAWIARRVLGDVSHDEAALLALTFPADSGSSPSTRAERPCWSAAWSFDSTSSGSNGARRAFLACLKSKAVAAPIDVPAAELIFGELLGNVVRHAPGRVDIVLDWTAELPVLHVLDRGPGFRSRRKRERLPVDQLSESGRGLFIVNACAPTFSVRNRNGRGTHASATLPLA
jgi:anti-sigma regulatory factor (Ser/Thr protein kinase)